MRPAPPKPPLQGTDRKANASGWLAVNVIQAAMAENLAPNHIPTDELVKVYEEWSDGDWGMVMTGKTSK